MSDAPLITTSHGTRPEAFGPTEWLLLASIALMWGSSFLFIAVGLDAFAPGLITPMRIAFGAACLGLVGARRGSIDRRDWSRIVILAFCWMAFPLSLFPFAQQWIDSSLAGMLNGAMPLTTALIAAILLRQVPGRWQVVGLVVGFGGVLLISLPSLDGASSTALGVAMILVAVVFYSLSVNIAVPLQQRYGALPVMFRAQLVALAMTLPLGLASVPSSSFAWDSLAAVAALGVLGTGLAFIAMGTLIGRAGATRGAVAIYFVPVVAIVAGVVFRDEVVGVPALLGTALVMGGAWLTSRQEAQARASSPAGAEPDLRPGLDTAT